MFRRFTGRRFALTAILISTLVGATPGTRAQEPAIVTEEVVDGRGQTVGEIDWTNLTVTALGEATTQEKALSAAREVLYQVLLVAPIDDATTVGDRIRLQPFRAVWLRELCAKAEVIRIAAKEDKHIAYVKARMTGKDGLMGVIFNPEPPALTTEKPAANAVATAPSSRQPVTSPVPVSPIAGAPEAEMRPGGTTARKETEPPKVTAQPEVPATPLSSPTLLALLVQHQKPHAARPGVMTPPESSQRPEQKSLGEHPQAAQPKPPAGQMLPGAGTPKSAASPEQQTDLPQINIPQTGPFTGLIIDARGLGLKRCISPKVLTESGKVIYGDFERFTEKQIEEAKSIGVVGFLSAPEAILKSRAGERPLVIKALRVDGAFSGNPVISDADGERVLAENARTKFFDKWAVAFLK